MTTSQETSFLSEISGGEPIPLGKLAYFRARQRNRLYELVLREFLNSDLTKADVARRTGKRPEQVTRLLGAPGNWTLDTVSDLMLAISGSELDFQRSPLVGRAHRNFAGPEWMRIDEPRTVSPVTLQTNSTIPTTATASGTSATAIEWRSR